MERETRYYRPTELRAMTDDGAPRISGYAAMFNSLSDDLGGFVEQIAPGAFSGSLETDDQRALWNHDTNHVLGRRSAGTLELHEDENGLAFTIYPPNTQAGRDALELVRRGDVKEMSFAFTVESPEDEDWKTTQRQLTRTLRRVRLYEVSPVAFPAYPQTSAAVRSRVEDFNRADNASPDEMPTGRSQAVEPEGNKAGEKAQARRNNRRRKIQLLETHMRGLED